MKKTNLIFACILTFTLTISAQKTSTSISTSSTSTNSSGDKHTDVTTTVSNSTSVSNSDDSYMFTSKFQSLNRVKVEKLLLERLKEYNVKKSGKNYVWSEQKDGALVFECKLTGSTMKMFLYKEEVSNSVYKKIKALGEEFQKVITKHANTTGNNNNANSARERVRRATRELERAKERLKRIEQENNNKH